MKNFTFSNYCTPAYLNVALGLAIITGTFLAGLRPEMIAAEALFIGIWALGLKWLCSKGYKIISWSLAVVPVILALYMVILVKNDVATKEGIDNKTPEKIPDNNNVKTPDNNSTLPKKPFFGEIAINAARANARAITDYISGKKQTVEKPNTKMH